MGTNAIEVQEAPPKARSLKIKVLDTAGDGKPAVNITMPISIVKFGMKVAQAFSPEMKSAQVDWDAVVAIIESGEVGKLVEVDDEAQHKHVEIWVD